MSRASSLWANGIVPYVINGRNFPSGSKGRVEIMKAINHWNDKTVIQFVPRKRNHSNYVEFKTTDDGDACSSPVGCVGGKQFVHCKNPGFSTIVHEIGHAVGIWHEQVRRDRNKYVKVHWNNIIEKRKHNFEIKSANSRGIGPYNYASIMHYGRRFFAKDKNKDTLTPLGGQAIGTARRLSAGDIRTVEILYSKGGDLQWYRHEGHQSGADNWRLDYGKRVGTGWQRFRGVFATSNGVIYGIEKNGDLKWYRHKGVRTGKVDWTQGTGKKVGSGWQRFRSVFATSKGVIYGIEKNGDLKWYRHKGVLTGAQDWVGNTGVKVGSGWQRFRKVFATSNGVIYAIEQNGDLKWYRHTGVNNGKATWASGSGKRVGTGWQRFRHVFATSGGVIYAVEHNYDLKWYRHNGWETGHVNWTPRKTGKKMGTGWKGTPLATDGGVIYRLL